MLVPDCVTVQPDKNKTGVVAIAPRRNSRRGEAEAMKKYFVFLTVACMGGLLVCSAWAQTNYAAGKTYTADPPLRTDWLGDSGGELTDGVKDWGWTPVTGWDGMAAANPREIVIDLGATQSDIGSVAVTVFVSISSTVAPQAQVLVLGSSTSATDGFVEWGEAVTSDSGNETNYTYTWEGGPAAARWVKVVLDSEAPGSHSLLSEIEVFQAEASDVSDEWMLYQ